LAHSGPIAAACGVWAVDLSPCARGRQTDTTARLSCPLAVLLTFRQVVPSARGTSPPPLVQGVPWLATDAPGTLPPTYSLFVGSGSALRNGGPAGILIAWILIGAMCVHSFVAFLAQRFGWLTDPHLRNDLPRLINVTQALGEMAIVFPVSGGQSRSLVVAGEEPRADPSMLFPSLGRLLHAHRAFPRPVFRFRHGLELRPPVGRRPAPRDHRRRHDRQVRLCSAALDCVVRARR
jgi:hypothetical protein